MRRRRIVGAVFLLFVVFGAEAALAQQDAVRMRVEPGALGLDGVVRPGSWAGLRLVLDHLGADDRAVILRWSLSDEDGDRVVSEREATLARQRDGQVVWLYAALPAMLAPNVRFTMRCVDAQTKKVLTSTVFSPDRDRLARPDDTVLAVTSGANLGLSDYQRHETTHAPLKIVRGLSLSTLPDRWMGLQMLSTLVWTQDLGGDPADPQQVGDAALEALREWCFRGGHLVVVLPAVNPTWFSSPLADLLPVKKSATRRVDTDRWGEPEWMGSLRPAEPETVSQTVFRVDDADTGPDAPTVLLRDAEGRPVVVAKRYGFGRVTLVGLDLTQSPVQRAGMPRGERRLWSRVFHWTAPVYTEAYVKDQEKDQAFVPARRLRRQNLAAFIGDQIAMSSTVGMLLLGAVVLFGLYWLGAGCLLQPLLKLRGWERLTWPVFFGVVLTMAMATWTVAVLLRPHEASLRHVTVLDVDGRTGISRARSFTSVFLPDFGTTTLAITNASVAALPGGAHNLLASPGLSGDRRARGFIEPRSYVMNAADPHAAALPSRSTTKQLVLDYVGPTAGHLAGLAYPFEMVARTDITSDADGWPQGELIHTLPGTLTNVTVIQCRGESVDRRGQKRQLPARVWRPVDPTGYNAWASGQPLILKGAVDNHRDLVMPQATYRADRDLTREGYLGDLLNQQKGLLSAMSAVDESVMARHFALLTFFDALPPPNVRRTQRPHDVLVARGVTGPMTDLTPLLHGRRLIVLGHLKSSPLPVPLTLDGETPPSEGWTFVRMIYDY